MATEKKMWGVLGGSFAILLIALAGAIYALGGQSKSIEFNTMSIGKLEEAVVKRFDQIDKQLVEIRIDIKHNGREDGRTSHRGR